MVALVRIMYWETVDSAISKPSFIVHHGWGAPHKGFSLLIRRMSSRSSWLPGAAPAE